MLLGQGRKFDIVCEATVDVAYRCIGLVLTQEVVETGSNGRIRPVHNCYYTFS